MRIGELARVSGTSAETIRYYERLGLLPAPPRTNANYREYGVYHRARLAFIRKCREMGLTLADVLVLLASRDQQGKSCDSIDELLARHMENTSRRIRELRRLYAELESLRAKCGRGRTSCTCGILTGIELAAEGAGSSGAAK